jgi:diguanylate cyclase (GGDEF)-like protein
MTDAAHSCDRSLDHTTDHAPDHATELPTDDSTDHSTGLVALGEFGPYDALADDAHARYLEGFSEQAVSVARRYLALTRAAGDVTTCRYLRYITAIALQDLGRHGDAVAEASGLADELGEDLEPVWRAKALSVVAESSIRIGEHGRAVAAMADADWLISQIRVGTYGHLSASMGLGLAMRSHNLLEQAEVRLVGIRDNGSGDVAILLALELALLSAYWGVALVVIGRDEEAAAQFALCAQRALRTRRAAESGDNAQMAARAEILEGFAQMHLGQLGLGAARARAAEGRFSRRLELVETYLLHLVLGRSALAEGRLDVARNHFEVVERYATTAGRDVWSIAATEGLADVHAAESGPHAGMDLWRSIAREALRRSWSEREGRFAALRDRNELRELAAHTARVGRAAVQDPLTGLGNRRVLEDFAGSAHPQASVVFIDVDDFKQVNDTFSHATGDTVLRDVAAILRQVSRDGDLLVRFGGDEFVVLSTGGIDGATALATRVHQAVRHHPWERLAPGLTVTVSIGVGRLAEAGPAALLAADSALMSAKRAGRDQVVVDAR